MHRSHDCHFCRIVAETRAGRNPFALAETQTTLIMLDRNQFVTARILVIGKAHNPSERDKEMERRFEDECELVKQALKLCHPHLAQIQVQEAVAMHLRCMLHPMEKASDPSINDGGFHTRTLTRPELEDLKVRIQKPLLVLIHKYGRARSDYHLSLTQNSPSEFPPLGP
ncbi:MAG: hypothetical protein WCW31_03260 [Patescibacteria group bacterium]